jgi:hypothetical protein
MATPPRDVQISRITTLHSIADRFIAIATHESVVRQIQLAFRDLAEALAEARLWLEEANVDQREPILKIAAMATDLAESRLGMVQIALETHGPNGSVVE